MCDRCAWARLRVSPPHPTHTNTTHTRKPHSYYAIEIGIDRVLTPKSLLVGRVTSLHAWLGQGLGCAVAGVGMQALSWALQVREGDPPCSPTTLELCVCPLLHRSSRPAHIARSIYHAPRSMLPPPPAGLGWIRVDRNE